MQASFGVNFASSDWTGFLVRKKKHIDSNDSSKTVMICITGDGPFISNVIRPKIENTAKKHVMAILIVNFLQRFFRLKILSFSSPPSTL